MKCSCGRHISTKEYMAGLDLQQLRFARDHVEDLIRQKESESKVVIYRVCEDGLCYGSYLDFRIAVKRLVQVAGDYTHLSDIPRELSISKQRVPESEVGDYIDGYTATPAKGADHG